MTASLSPLPMSIQHTDQLLAATHVELRRARQPGSRLAGWWRDPATTVAHQQVLRHRLDLYLDHRLVLARREVRRLELWWQVAWPGTTSQAVES